MKLAVGLVWGAGKRTGVCIGVWGNPDNESGLSDRLKSTLSGWESSRTQAVSDFSREATFIDNDFGRSRLESYEPAISINSRIYIYMIVFAASCQLSNFSCLFLLFLGRFREKGETLEVLTRAHVHRRHLAHAHM